MVFALLRAKKKRSPNRRWILTTMAGNDSVNFSRFHRGFRNGYGSGAFFFALMTPSWLNGYAVHASARRLNTAKISPERIDSFRKALTALALPVLHRQTGKHWLSPPSARIPM